MHRERGPEGFFERAETVIDPPPSDRLRRPAQTTLHHSMVTAARGVLITTDVQLATIIKSFNASREPTKRFIVAEVSPTQLLIKADAIESVRAEVKKYTEALHFEVEKYA